ncbi:MAG: dihydrodipicolinate synthase family protein, partial [Muriicola sp.]
MEQLYGTGVALVTPFKKDGSVDVEALRRVVRYSI